MFTELVDGPEQDRGVTGHGTKRHQPHHHGRQSLLPPFRIAPSPLAIWKAAHMEKEKKKQKSRFSPWGEGAGTRLWTFEKLIVPPFDLHICTGGGAVVAVLSPSQRGTTTPNPEPSRRSTSRRRRRLRRHAARLFTPLGGANSPGPMPVIFATSLLDAADPYLQLLGQGHRARGWRSGATGHFMPAIIPVPQRRYIAP